jgi:hypothetical protein
LPFAPIHSRGRRFFLRHADGVNSFGSAALPRARAHAWDGTDDYTITDEVRVTQSDMREKILYLQRIEFEDKRIEVRLGYYIIGKKPNMRGRWVWGQFAALMPLQDFRALVRAAKKKGWI